MRASVVFSTYNQPAALERVLWGYALQSHRDFELLVADDGSGPETAEVIRRVREAAGLEVLHVRHADHGFRKCEILNQAIVRSRGDYLIFSDGDCIPRADFVGTHLALAERGRFLSGGCLRLSRAVSDKVGVEEVRSGRFADLAWLRAQGWRPGRHALRAMRARRVAAILDALTPTRTQFGGHNASAFRDDVLAVNGFDATMGYGGLDRALGYRLRNLGVRGKQVRFRAVCVHLHHERPYRDAAVMRQNREILARILSSGEVRARRGIAELEPLPTAPS